MRAYSTLLQCELTPAARASANQLSPKAKSMPAPEMSESALLLADDQIVELMVQAVVRETAAPLATAQAVATRLALEIQRICRKSKRIQSSGEVSAWQRSIGQNRLQKYFEYYRLGSRRGRAELHSRLSAIAYRHIAPAQMQLGFQGRCGLLEDFLQGFYIEVLRAFRREHTLSPVYTPQTRLELAEYMAFSELYAKRRIALPGSANQQLIVLRSRAFAHRLPAETTMDIESATDLAHSEAVEEMARSPIFQQIRERLVAERSDPAEAMLRNRVIQALITYLHSQGQSDCADYLILRLQDMAAADIDQVLSLTVRQRDYLQQRLKYHVQRFAQFHSWELVHEWLGADLDKNFGLAPQSWQRFLAQLSPEQLQLIRLRQQAQRAKSPSSEKAIAEQLGQTPKQVRRNWGQIVGLAWQFRNQNKG